MALPHDAQPSSPSSDSDKIRAAVARFGAELGPRMRGDGRDEDRLRAPVYTLLKALGDILGRALVVHDEVTLVDLSSRPDFAVDVAGNRLGYLELKAPEKGIPENWHPTKHDREQWIKLSNLPNLVYTNGTCWALYHNGVLSGDVARLHGDLSRAGDRLVPADDRFERLFRDFLAWKPDCPTSVGGVVSELAPLCRLLRDQVADTMAYERTSPGRRPLTTLAGEWRDILFPTLDDAEFANAYAQAVTFALLLARVDGISFDGRSLSDVAGQLSKQHSLMGEALSILTNPRWVDHLSIIEMLRRVIGNIDWGDVHLDRSEAYTLLYETFLSKYDPELRRQSGTYYTPDSVARAMVKFVDHVLKTRLEKSRGFAAEDVIVVDPAMGTGTFLVEIIDSVVATLQRERNSDVVPEAHLRELFSNRLVGFELQAAPYAVAELRLHQALKNRYGVELPREEVRFLSNVFDDPDKLSLNFGQLYEVLKEAGEGANRIKRDVPVMVVIGNPPWRERARGAAPWLEAPRNARILAPTDLSGRPSLDEFRARSQATRAFNLSNMWTFFWRWATWKVFDAHPLEPAGIVALITPKAYVTSEAYGGMRRYLRETADEGWIIDVTPEEHRSDARTRLFPGVQQTICIGVFARFNAPDRTRPARIHYTAVAGRRQQKFDQLLALLPDGASWKTCSSAWEAPFRPTDSAWDSYPKLGDLLPWHQTGISSNRNWVWAPDAHTIRHRWSTLVHADEAAKAHLLKETRDRSVNRTFLPLAGVPSGRLPLRDETSKEPKVVRAAFRSFDRQYLIHDRRVIDFPRADLWQVQSDVQVYATEQHAHPFADGAALSFSSLVPNVDHFNGRGGRVLPLYRDDEGHEANVAPGLLMKLGKLFGSPVSAENLLAYVAALVAHSGYTRRFREELTTPGIHVPITAEATLWNEAVEIGQNILWLHTYGERCVDEDGERPRACPLLPEGKRPRYVESIPTSESQMPDKIEYDPVSETMTIGEQTLSYRAGRIEGVSQAVWEYTVGGVQVIRKWFSYRQRNPRKRKRTSKLDDINPTRWTSEFDDALLELVNVLGRCVALESRQSHLLERVCAGSLVTVSDLEAEGVLPVPNTSRNAPGHRPTLFHG